MGDVGPERRVDLILQSHAAVFGKIGLDGFLTRMSERRIAHIVRQSGSLNDGSYLFEQRSGQFRMPLDEDMSHVVAQRLAERRYF